VPDLRLEKGPASLELDHVSAAKCLDRLGCSMRQLPLIERAELLLDLPQLVRDAVESAHVGRVERGEDRVDSVAGLHPTTVPSPAGGVKALERALGPCRGTSRAPVAQCSAAACRTMAY
jgi:hypothetical protein